MTRRLHINVTGIIQGVGFRPNVYRLAIRDGLDGFVANRLGSVEIEVEGPDEALERFLKALKEEAPPRAWIESVKVQEMKNAVQLEGTPGPMVSRFQILESDSGSGGVQPVPSDIATCDDCLRELKNPGNRRFGYAFTNCTNCGPRFTIIKDLPYDRPYTTMSVFPMCPACEKEYRNPLDRRFHAQPNACPVCGPQLHLLDAQGKPVELEAGVDAVAMAVTQLKEGLILAVKGLGGFLLACDARNENAVATLRQRKHRPAKPLAVMVPDVEGAEQLCHVTIDERGLLLSAAAPIVLLKKRPSMLLAGSVAPGTPTLGVMLPYTPLHHLLMSGVGGPLVMTSGNLSEEPIARDNREALERLGRLVDGFLMHNRDILMRCDDSVVAWSNGLMPIRRARGMAPEPIALGWDSIPVLACGALEKNTFTVTRDRLALVSQHIGDMENLETEEHFRETADWFQRMFRIAPQCIVVDRHPDYLSSNLGRRWAKESGLPLVEVQHHHAHMASCMAENRVTGPVIGVCFDGTGYGDDGTIWGGEFLLGDYRSFRRVGHLEAVPLPGGDAGVRHPSRMALSLAKTVLGEESARQVATWLPDLKASEAELVLQIGEKRLASPLTSSAGRLFDAVAALAGLRGVALYEGQAAVELEAVAWEWVGEGEPAKAGRNHRLKPAGALGVGVCEVDGETDGVYGIDVVQDGECWIWRLSGLVSGILLDRELGIGAAEIGWKFHEGVSRAVVSTCELIRRESGVSEVALSGGCFQNRMLLTRCVQLLGEMGFKVWTHGKVPCNDGGLSLGQAAVAHWVRSTS